MLAEKLKDNSYGSCHWYRPLTPFKFFNFRIIRMIIEE